MVTGLGVPGRIIAGWERPVFFPGHVALVWTNLNGSVKPEVIQVFTDRSRKNVPQVMDLINGKLREE